MLAYLKKVLYNYKEKTMTGLETYQLYRKRDSYE